MPGPPATPIGSLFLADGRIVNEIRRPTMSDILDQLKGLEA